MSESSTPGGRGDTLPGTTTVVDTDIAHGSSVAALPPKIGRYVTLEVVGAGGMGVVCTAYDPKLDRKVALKLLNDKPDRAETMITAGQARLFREAQALAKLSHPNVITVHDVDTFEGHIYIAMEYVEGMSLRDWLRKQRHGWREIVSVYLHAGRGLAAAHAAGIVHRDFKPANVLLGNDGRVRVVDFGLAKSDRDDDSDDTPVGQEISGSIFAMMRAASGLTLTQAGHSVGTPAYMAPEQHLGLPVGAYTDQFSFCVSVYEALYGALPFAAPDAEVHFRNVIEGRVRDPPRDSDVPPRIFRILVRGLRVRPEERYPSMDALLAALADDPSKRRKRFAAVAAAVLLVGSSVGAIAMVARSEGLKCEVPAAKFAGAWGEARQLAIEEAFSRTNVPYARDTWERVRQGITQFESEWRTTYTTVCEASRVTGEQSDQLLDVRMACLHDALLQLQAVTEVFSDADSKVIEKAVPALQELPDLLACKTVDETPAHRKLPTDDQLRASIEALVDRLEHARALRAAGKASEAEAEAQTIVAKARTLAYLPLEARATLALGLSQIDAGDASAGRSQLESVLTLAARLEDAELETLAWPTLLHVIGQTQHEVAVALALPARTAVLRAGNRDEANARLETSIGNVHFVGSNLAEAAAHQRKALELFERVYGRDDPRLSTVLINLATVLANTGSLEDARAMYERALGMTEQALGPQHPRVAIARHNLGNILASQGLQEQALVHYRAALAIRERSLGENHPDVADSLVPLGGFARRNGNHAEADALYRRALGIMERELGKNHPRLVPAYNNLGVVKQDLRAHEEALQLHMHALSIAEANHGPKHRAFASTLRHACRASAGTPVVSRTRELCARAVAVFAQLEQPQDDDHAEVLTILASSEIDAGARANAVDHLRTAVRLGQAAKADAVVAEAAFQLARALWPGGREEAREMAILASDLYEKLRRREQFKQVQTWLSDH